MQADTWNAAITWLDEPLRRERDGRAARGAHAPRQGPDRHRRDPDDLRLADLRRPRARAQRERRRPRPRRGRDRPRQGEPLRVRLGRARRRTRGTAPCATRLRPGRTTGGSSSGNAAAIAAGLCELGIGTDTGCSVRLPAAACEIVGLKTRLGVVPIDGVFPLRPSFDTVGPMARTVRDAATLWSVLTGRDVPEPRLAGLTVGVLRRAPSLADGRETETSDAAEAWVERLESLGARVVEATIPGPAANTWPVFQHEAARSHAATFPARADEYGAGPREAHRGAGGRPGRRDRGLPRAPRVAPAPAGRRPLRQPVRRDRLAGRGRRRARRAAAALVVPPLGQPARLVGARDRQPPARGAARRGRARGRARLGGG